MLRLVSRAALACGALCLLSLGCSSTENTSVDDVPGLTVEEWWNNPGAVKDALTAVGSYPVTNELAIGQARQNAVINGRFELAAALKAKIDALSENWNKSVGDLSKPASFSNYTNDETMIRQHVDAVVQGAQAYKYKQVGSTMYVLMVLKSPGEWTQNVLDDATDDALKDATLFRTEIMKNDFRKRMDALKEEEQRKIQEAQQRIIDSADSL